MFGKPRGLIVSFGTGFHTFGETKGSPGPRATLPSRISMRRVPCNTGEEVVRVVAMMPDEFTLRLPAQSSNATLGGNGNAQDGPLRAGTSPADYGEA